MLDALQYEFMRHAVTAGLMASLVCGIMGTLVVVNRIVFLSGGIAHAAYGGIGLSFYFGLPPLFGTMAFSIASSSVMAAVTLKRKHMADTVIGVLWAVGMALGIILVDLTPGYSVDLMSFLFGSILAVPRAELWQMGLLTAAVICLTALFYKGFLAMSYDEEFAKLRGIPVRALYFLLVAMVAVSVVITIRVVGLILVIALLTIPPFIAEMLSNSMAAMMVIASVLSAAFTLTGLWLSYSFNLTSGATIILVSAVGFFLALGVRSLRRRTNGPARG